MGTVVLPNMVFLHTPKTGGDWVSSAARAIGLPGREYPVKHASFAELRVEVSRSLLRRVRAQSGGLVSVVVAIPNGDELGALSRRDLQGMLSDVFFRFVENVIDFYPGFRGGVFETFVGKRDDEVGFIGRHENLEGDFVRALGDRHPVDRARVSQVPRVDESPRCHVARYEEKTLERLYQAERGTFTRFGYPVPTLAQFAV